MSFNFQQFPSQIFPAPTGQPLAKDVVCKAVKLTNANFSTGGTTTAVAYVPADASIIGFKLWVKTQLAGGSVSAATMSVGVPGTNTQFINGSTAAFGTAGAETLLSPVSNIFQVYDPTVPTGDTQITVTGTATTGNPTSGEMYLLIEYVR
jgi:hypothetical protein